MKECANCGFNDEIFRCLCLSSDKWYACPIENKKPENIQALKDCADFLEKARECVESEEQRMTKEQLIEIAEKLSKWLDDISAEYHIDKIELQGIIKLFLIG